MMDEIFYNVFAGILSVPIGFYMFNLALWIGIVIKNVFSRNKADLKEELKFAMLFPMLVLIWIVIMIFNDPDKDCSGLKVLFFVLGVCYAVGVFIYIGDDNLLWAGMFAVGTIGAFYSAFGPDPREIGKAKKKEPEEHK